MPTLGSSNQRTTVAQEGRRRHEVGVEDGDHLAARLLEPGGQRARLVSGALGAVQVADVRSAPPVALAQTAHHRRRLVVGVVEHLDLEAIARIVEAAGGVEQARSDVELVVEWQLHGHPRPDGRLGGRRQRRAVLALEPQQQGAMQAVQRQHSQRQVVGEQDQIPDLHR